MSLSLDPIVRVPVEQFLREYDGRPVFEGVNDEGDDDDDCTVLEGEKEGRLNR